MLRACIQLMLLEKKKKNIFSGDAEGGMQTPSDGCVCVWADNSTGSLQRVS